MSDDQLVICPHCDQDQHLFCLGRVWNLPHTATLARCECQHPVCRDAVA